MNIWTSKVFKRKNNTFYGYVCKNSSNNRTYVYAKTAAECRRKLAQTANEIEENAFSEKIKMNAFVNQWFESRCSNLSPTTIKEWKRLSDKVIVPSLGDKSISDIKQKDIQSVITKYNSNHSQKSTQSLKGLIHNIFEFAVINELISKNPCEKILITQTPKYEYYIYNEKEYERLLMCAKGTEHELVALLAGMCGLRKSEIFGLRWSDIDLDNRSIHIRQVVVSPDNVPIIKPVPKTAASAGTIIIPERVVQFLTGIEDKTGLLIHESNGKPKIPSNYQKRFRDFLIRNKLPETRVHDLRHFAATTLMNAGVPDKFISEYLRHSDTNITKLYQHILDNKKTIAADAIDNIFNRVS